MRTQTKIGAGIAIVLATILLSRPLIDHLGAKNVLPGNTVENELSPERVALLAPDELVARLNIPKGGTVLDLGAGFGLFTFRLGRAVGPRGKVFASDIDPKVVAQLAERARKEGLSNVEPVQVSERGVDPFYRRHTFDVIYASDVITEIRGPERFFDQLRASLRPETGRLWIVSMRPDPDFTMAEFSSGALRRALLAGKRQEPLLRRLSDATRKALDAQPATANDEAFTSAAVADLNRMLADPGLWPEAQTQRWPLNRQDANLRQTLSTLLKTAEAFADPARTTNDTPRALRLLNRLLIADLLDSDTWGKAFALNTLTPAQLRPMLAPLLRETFCGRPVFFETVGYETVGEHAENPYCYVWELKRTR